MLHEIIKTGDGSHSLFVKELNEHYHSIHGAIQESKHVFIEAGFKQTISLFASDKKESKCVSILEIGLGTGLNVLLTILENQQFKFNVTYTALEAFPLAPEMASRLNYTDLLAQNGNAQKELKFVFDRIYSSNWNEKIEIAPLFTLNKIENTLQEMNFQEAYDLIYFDAFGPAVQPEMWTEDVFRKIFNAMNEQSTLVTYCAKGIVKRTMKSVGFKIETLQGPPGKREMIRAIKAYGVEK